jgi:hypothetical protein
MLKIKKSESFQDEHLSNTMRSANKALKEVVAFSIPSSLNTLKLTLITLSIMSVIFFVSPSFTFKNAEARCPNGTHKSPSGDCEEVKPHEGQHRCQNGHHRSPDGVCERVGSGGSDSSSNNDDNNDNEQDDDNSIPSTSSSFSSNNEQNQARQRLELLTHYKYLNLLLPASFLPRIQQLEQHHHNN